MAQFSNRRRWGLISNPLPDKPWFRDTIPRGRLRLEMAITKGLAISSSKSKVSSLLESGELISIFIRFQIIWQSEFWQIMQSRLKIAKAGHPARWPALGLIFRYWTLSSRFVREIKDYDWIYGGKFMTWSTIVSITPSLCINAPSVRYCLTLPSSRP